MSTVSAARGPSRSFEIRRLLPAGAGAERIKARATSPSGATCTVRATGG